MPKYTHEELNEARYELYLMSDEPKRDQDRHEGLADAALIDLERAGWKVLEKKMVREPFTDFAVVEVVIRKDDQLKLIRWHPGNKGWFEKLSAGWGIFKA